MRVRAPLLVLIATLAGCAEHPSLASPATPTRKGWGALPPCGFPREASASVNHASVTLRVLVRRDGTPERVDVLEDPGFGFGAQAARCAMAQKFSPATDDSGRFVTAWTPSFKLRFAR